MLSVQQSILSKLPFFEDLQALTVDDLEKNLQEFKFVAGEHITVQYAPAVYFYFLTEGEVSFEIQIEGQQQENFKVGKSKGLFTPLGWSGFRSPHRYATSDIALTDCKVVAWKHTYLQELFRKEPEVAQQFMSFVYSHAFELLTEIREDLQRKQTHDIPLGNIVAQPKETFTSKTAKQNLLRSSSFWEVFEEKELRLLADSATTHTYQPGELLYKQGDQTDCFSILINGSINLVFENDHQNTLIRQIDQQGYTLSWSCFINTLNQDVHVVANRETEVLTIPQSVIDILSMKDVDFNQTFINRMGWLLGNMLRSARTKYISLYFEREALAVTTLIEQNCAQLSITSQIHEVPHLLMSITTQGLAFKILNYLKNGGTTLEKSIAKLALEELQEVEKEYKFYQGLREVYQNVARAPFDRPAEDIRMECADELIQLFDTVPQVIEGWENLPEESGCIFIYNHLLNHPHNTLPNKFQITLDSHFLSSNILHKKYGDPGIRVVRVGTGPEYGHQDYYSRLGHINVYTPESDKLVETPEQRQQRKEEFFETALEHLKNGTNLLISPEGTSRETHESPGRIKPGAFILAAKANVPIVPIAIANFDKRIRNNKWGVKILKPFYINDLVENPLEKEQLFAFLNAYENQYRSYVKEAINLTR